MRTWFRSLLMPRSLLGLTLFVLPWLWVLGAFAPRALFVKQVTGNTNFPPAMPWADSLPYPYGSKSSWPQNIPSSFEADFITDSQVQAKIAEQNARLAQSPLPGQPKSAEMGYYKGVIRRFPRESWLYAHYLRVAVSSFKDERSGGAFSSRGRISLYANAPESTGVPPNFSPEQLDAALQIARQGQALEPDNAVFGLYEGVLLWMGHRDDEAWRALHRASLLPRYDDHTCEDTQATLKVYQLQRGSLSWEEQVGLKAVAFFPQSAQLREKSRQWSWAAWKLERAGHHRDAINKRADLARLFGKTMHGRNTLISGLVGAAIQADMWSGNPNRHVNVRQLTSRQRENVVFTSRLGAQKFADYARAHGEPALAPETVRLGQATGQFRAFSRAVLTAPMFDNIPLALVYQTRALWWAGCGLLGSGIVVFVAWLMTSVLLIGAGGEAAKARFVFSVVGLCVALSALIYGKYSGSTDDMVAYAGGSFSQDAIHGVAFLQGVALLLPVAFPALASGIPTSLGVWGARRAARRRAPQRSATPSAAVPGEETPPKPPSQKATPSSDERAHLPRDMRPLLWSFLSWCALLGTLGGWILWIDPTSVLPIGHTENAETLAYYAVIWAALSSALWLAIWVVKWRFFAPVAERTLRHSALRRFNTALGVLLLVGSWGYALTLHASLAPRREADRLSALDLQLGEIGALEANHAQVSQPQKSTP